jgi:hypothetical protein
LQPSPLDLRARLRQRFAIAGFSEALAVDAGQTPDMLFQAGTTSVRLVIVDESFWMDRQNFLNSMMRATALAGKSNRIYLALPKTAASVVDAQLFHARGIGLFTYDHRNVDEALPARYFETESIATPDDDKVKTNQFENEIKELRGQVDSLERTVQSLSEELMMLKRTNPRSEPIKPYVTPPVLPTLTASHAQPAFFSGNPWLEVLSKRGKGEARIAC